MPRATKRATPWPSGASDVEVLHLQRMSLDELTARLDLITHEDAEKLVGTQGVVDAHLAQHASVGVHGGLPQLARVHLAKALVTADAQAAAAALVEETGELFRVAEKRL